MAAFGCTCSVRLLQYTFRNLNFHVPLQTGLRRLVKGEGDFAQVFQKEDQASVHEQIVARVNKYSRQLQERAEKELDHMPFPS